MAKMMLGFEGGGGGDGEGKEEGREVVVVVA